MAAPPTFSKGDFSRDREVKGSFRDWIDVPIRDKSGERSSTTKKRYCVTDSPDHIDLDALEAAFASPLVWWAGPPSSREQLEALVQNSYCFGLHLDTEMVGFARLVTDYVTFAYLTDVYVLEEHQGHGLGRSMMECIHGVLEKWPDLRRGLLITNGGSGAEGTYRKVFGAVDIRERPAKEGIGELIAMEWRYEKGK
ncbi:hypothetical protein QBC37DRAFT_367468 [Rhypophila decipiens]|uniref:N-acetyltransferase domain-containing protein n=1 Tax=Rhypophila decipiens TaxID=261697 RepID=A0AAN7BDK0_9PEZI|nr:hypothetical protein QBC37DRAFT_367468 [Rhypophila decipiens]